MRRRTVLRALAAGTATLGGCNGVVLGDDATSATSTATDAETATRTPAGELISPQWATLRNSRSTTEYVTFVVARGDRTLFLDSREMLPGEDFRFSNMVARAGEYDVVVETESGDRRRYPWEATAELGGMHVTLANDIQIWRAQRCTPGCPPLNETSFETGLPLIGDGRHRWNTPGGVVLRNPTDAETTVRLDVELYGRGVVDADYRVPASTQLFVPLTFRTGRYTVDVTANGETRTNEWPVPEVPWRYVVLDDPVRFGCGPAITTLFLENLDTKSHDVRLRVHRDEEQVFEYATTLDANGREEVKPVEASGPYTVDAETDDGSQFRGTWWPCPPRGAAVLSVDATGSFFLQQDGPQPG